MRITKLHLMLLAIIAVILGLYVYQIQQEKKRLQEIASAATAREEERKRAQEEKRRAEEEQRAQETLAQKQDLAVQAVAVAGEYRLLAKKEGKDVSRGQETLRQAKEYLGRQDFEAAWEMARRSIDEFKNAPQLVLHYRIRRGDSLWKIAQMPRHYGRGSQWPRIWRANQKKIPDFDLVYPRQVLLIPKNNTEKQR
ncbi:MAG: LysM peptidoglycan-binding domain-containing protein [Endomicrobiales bacterium]